MKTITIEINDTVYELLAVLTHTFPRHFGFHESNQRHEEVKAVVMKLIDHAQQGVYRPGAWERAWLMQAFGDDWLNFLEPGDPYGRGHTAATAMFDRPRRVS